MRRTGTTRSTRGLTLIELAVVIALVVTLVTLAVPGFADHLARHRLRAAGQALLAEMQEARYAAAQRQQTLHLSFAGGADACWSLALAPGCDCRVAQRCRLRAVPLAQYKGVELVDWEDAHFESTGTGAGHAALRSSRGHVLRVEVSPLGRSRLCSPGQAQPGVPGC